MSFHKPKLQYCPRCSKCHPAQCALICPKHPYIRDLITEDYAYKLMALDSLKNRHLRQQLRLKFTIQFIDKKYTDI